jgi:hypothetical protein
MCTGHFCFQCTYTYNESLASFCSNDANRKVIEHVLYEGVHELLPKIMILIMSGDDEFLQIAYRTLQYIVKYFQR